MRTFKKFATLAVTAFSVAAIMNACSDPAGDLAKPSNEVSLKPVKSIGGTTACDVTSIAANRTFDRDTIYLLKGDVRVNNNATLTIESGTIIRGDKASTGTLTIERGAKIIANGTASQPIVFTSGAAAGLRAQNDWGGLIILGKAPNNQGLNQSPEGYPVCVTAPQYGGIDCSDNSGVLRYVRIEWAGKSASADNEKNGLSMYSVGSGTTLEHIMVSYGADDAFEWFGGCVNAKYLISYRNKDDDFDSDHGFSGKVQYGLAFRDPALADGSASNGFESDNDAGGSSNTPQTSAVFSNFTLVGPYDPEALRTVTNNAPPAGERFGDGLHLRRNTGIDVHNSLIVGWQSRGVFVATGVTGVTLSHNTVTVPMVTGAAVVAEPVGGPWSTGTSNLSGTATSISCGSGTDLASLSELDCFLAWDLADPNATPVSGATILTSGRDASLLDPFFEANETTTSSTTYFRGALREADDNGWDLTGGWVNYDPQNTPYN